MASISARLKHAWNAFLGQDTDTIMRSYDTAFAFGGRPDRPRLTYSNERSIISSILTRLSIDVSSVGIRHVRLDDNERFLEDVDSGLNNCLTLEANIDQAGRRFVKTSRPHSSTRVWLRSFQSIPRSTRTLRAVSTFRPCASVKSWAGCRNMSSSGVQREEGSPRGHHPS